MHKKPEQVVITDLAQGDDLLAVAAVVSEQNPSIFIGSFGNRATDVSTKNLSTTIPQLENALNLKRKRPARIYHGVSRATGKRSNYSIPENGIEYFIHGDMGHDHSPQTRLKPEQRSKALYDALRQSDKELNILSLAATTELYQILNILAGHCSILSIVIMGGVLNIQGNTGPHQEANFRHDPSATQNAFDIANKNNIPTVLVPLDTTEREEVLFTPDRMKFLKDKLRHATAGFRMIEEISQTGPYGQFYLGRTRNADGFPYPQVRYSGVPVHDLTAKIVQSDFLGKDGIFQFSTVPVQFDPLGNTGIARFYMENQYPVIVAGGAINFDAYWKEIITLFKRFH